MIFSFDSVKPKTKLHNEDFYFDTETPRGHFFAVLDFAAHDYANLNPTLKGKLETIVGSFASLDDFSDELFLGFLAKEVNNFVSNLADQSSGPELFFSAALCLVSNDHLAYFLSGNVTIDILNAEGLVQLKTGTPAMQLGARNLDSPPKDGIDSFKLDDDDLVLITTQGLAEVLPASVNSLRNLEPKAICELLIKASTASVEDRTVVVIGGPYVRRLEVSESPALAELKSALTLLTARLDALTEAEASRRSGPVRLDSSDALGLEDRLSQEIVTLKDDLEAKAASIDLLELDEKVKVLSAALASKADTADVLGLQRDVLKLGLSAATTTPSEPTPPVVIAPPVEPPPNKSVGEPIEHPDQYEPASPPPSILKMAAIVVAISLVAGFAGGWLHARATKKAPEAWSVTTTENQIVISRLDGPSREDVTIKATEPLKVTGLQTFSSFADVKRYLETISSATSLPAQPSAENQSQSTTEIKSPEQVREIRIKQGDTLKGLAQAYNVPAEKIMALNPSVTRWPSIRIGTKVFVPIAGGTASVPSSTPAPVDSVAATTTQVTIGPGDSLNELARRFNTSAERLKELNPNVNWPRIQTGQKVVVPTPTPLGG